MAGSLPEGFRFIHKIPPTPLVPVTVDGAGDIWCKLEFLNPSGSTKDRIARHILEKAWRNGVIREGDTVVEASSGSTSIALALVCAQLGLRFIASIPESATDERAWIIQAYGGEVRRVSGGMGEVLELAHNEAEANHWFQVRQFANLDNVEAHRIGTGREILTQVPGGYVDAVVSGIGTGGTLQGLYEASVSAGCAAKAVAAIPRDSGVFGENVECCSLKFSANVPGVVDGLSELYSNWRETLPEGVLEEINVDCGLCLDLTRQLWSKGFPVGPSSGLNIAAAHVIKNKLGADARVVTVFPARMERYFSHKVFEDLRDS